MAAVRTYACLGPVYPELVQALLAYSCSQQVSSAWPLTNKDLDCPSTENCANETILQSASLLLCILIEQALRVMFLTYLSHENYF